MPYQRFEPRAELSSFVETLWLYRGDGDRVYNRRMTSPALATWVQPIAVETEEGAKEVLDFARSQPADVWNRPSPLEGWTCRDILAHLAGDCGKVTSLALRAAVTGRPIDNPPDLADGGAAANARDVAERREHMVQELIAEIERDREQWRDLMARLKDADEDARWEGFPLSLGQYLRLCAGHDREHLAHLLAALTEGTRA